MDIFEIDPDDPEFEIRLHDFAGNNIYFWERQADTLLLSAQILKDHLKDEGDEVEMHYDAGMLHTMLMLRGFAVECLFKAIYLRQGNQLFSGGCWANGLSDVFKNHQLHQMADQLSIDFDRADKRLLEVLCYAVLVTGRYPVPNRYDLPHRLGSMSLGADENAGWQGREDEACFQRVLDKIKPYHGPLRYHGKH